MAGVGGVGEKFKATDAELDALAGHEDIKTSAVLDKVAKDAGYLSAPMNLRGDSKSYGELREEYTHVSHNLPALGALGAKAFDGAELAGLIPEHAGAVAGLGVVAPLVGEAMMYLEVREAWVRGKELSEALARDELRVAMLTQLDLPEGFRHAQLERYEHSGKGHQSGTMKMATWFAGPDKPLRAVLQLHCDQGMSAARDACEARIGRDAYFQVYPEAAKRYAEDAAFKAGFDAILWARDKGDAEYRTAVDALRVRIGAYDQHHVAWRA
jgi:hypothetical protein